MLSKGGGKDGRTQQVCVERGGGQLEKTRQRLSKGDTAITTPSKGVKRTLKLRTHLSVPENGGIGERIHESVSTSSPGISESSIHRNDEFLIIRGTGWAMTRALADPWRLEENKKTSENGEKGEGIYERDQ